ncbi:MAG: DUF4386 family protein [Actinomycetota bacterium]
MDNRRLAAIGGIGFVVLQIFTNVIPGGSPPTLTDSTTKVVNYFADKHDRLFIGNAANTLSGIFAVLFFVALYKLLRQERPATEAWPLLGLVGTIIGGTFITVGQAMSTMALFEGKAVPGVTVVFNQVSVIIFEMSGVMLAVALLGFGLAQLRSAVMASWLGQLALLGALAGTIGSLFAGVKSDSWAYVGFVAYIIFLVWILLTSIMLMRSAQPTPAST